jgi:hypothetical protein
MLCIQSYLAPIEVPQYNWGGTWKKSSGSGLESENMALGIWHADHVAPSILKSWHYYDSGRSVGIVL